MAMWEHYRVEVSGDRRRGQRQPTEAEKQAEENDRAVQRARADLRELRERTSRQQERRDHRTRAQIVGDLLPVIDDLDRVLQHAPAGDPVAEGVSMAVVQFERALQKVGAEPYEPHGEPFDPARHEALAVDDRDAAPDTVVEVLARGWSVDNVVVRAAKVIVQPAE